MNSLLCRPSFALRSALSLGAVLLCAAATPLYAQQNQDPAGAKVSEVAPLAIVEGKPTVIKISSSTTTTIVFPFEVENVHGAGFTSDPAKWPGEYFISGGQLYRGTKVISLNGIPGSKPTRRNLNIFSGDQVYVLMIEPAEGEVPAVVRLSKAGGPTAARNEIPAPR